MSSAISRGHRGRLIVDDHRQGCTGRELADDDDRDGNLVRERIDSANCPVP